MAEEALMRTISLVIVLWAFGASSLLAQDPVKIDPAHHKVELENADVRVLRIVFGPGEKAPAHDHPNSVAVFVTDAQNRVMPVGQKPDDTPRKRGDVVLLNAGKHEVENIGKARSEVVLIELKRPGSTTYKGMALDPAKVDPKHYSVVAENAHARVIHARVPAGESSAVHEHPSNVVVRLNDSPTQKAGTVTWAPGPEKHGGDKPAATPTDVIIVELKSGIGAS
jgi:quercetin dioxygenase-like cupin family protein